MSLWAEWIRYGQNQEYIGYIAKPQQTTQRMPVVLVFQEVWGVDAHIQDVANRFAQAGYIAFAPDLYAKQGERPAALTNERIQEMKKFLDSLPASAWGNMEERNRELAKLPPDQQQRIGETLQVLFSGTQPSNYVDQLLATTSFLRSEYPQTQEQGIGSVGFCMGGALSAHLACRDPQLKGAIIFYGNAPDKELAANIQCPVLGFYGGLDKRITDNVPAFADEMQGLGKSFEYHVYEGAHHAFFNDTRASYHVEAARDAFARALVFFNEVL